MKRADSAASTMSQLQARLMPAPAATPLIAAIRGASPRVKREIAPCRKVVTSFMWAGRSSPCAANDLRSPPAQKKRPDPVSRMARTLGSLLVASETCIRSMAICRLIALAASGRFRVMCATWSRSSYVSVS